MTFTPLQGISTVVKRFLHERSADRFKVVMTIDDVKHYTEEEKQKIIASYPPHELEARTKGIPVLGSGRNARGRRHRTGAAIPGARFEYASRTCAV
jgi:hypothetical protein